MVHTGNLLCMINREDKLENTDKTVKCSKSVFDKTSMDNVIFLSIAMDS